MHKENTVLLVDDDQLLLNSLKRSLHQEHYAIRTATSAEAALEILSGIEVDVIVSDQCMPGMSGTDFLAMAHEKYPETLRIMLTGKPELNTAMDAINRGQIYRFFTKPCNAIDLALSIREALQQKAFLSQARRMLDTMKMQARYIEKLEGEITDLGEVKRDQSGAVVLEERPYDLTALCHELEVEIDEAARRLGAAPKK